MYGIAAADKNIQSESRRYARPLREHTPARVGFIPIFADAENIVPDELIAMPVADFVKTMLKGNISSSDTMFEQPITARNQSTGLGGLHLLAKTDRASNLEASLENQREYLRALQDDWDGYGASKLAPGVIDAIIEDIKALPIAEIPVPDLIPGSDGSIQAEWHLMYLTVKYGISTLGERYMHVTEFRTMGEHEYFAPDAATALQKWAPELAKDG